MPRIGQRISERGAPATRCTTVAVGGVRTVSRVAPVFDGCGLGAFGVFAGGGQSDCTVLLPSSSFGCAEPGTRYRGAGEQAFAAPDGQVVQPSGLFRTAFRDGSVRISRIPGSFAIRPARRVGRMHGQDNFLRPVAFRLISSGAIFRQIIVLSLADSASGHRQCCPGVFSGSGRGKVFKAISPVI